MLHALTLITGGDYTVGEVAIITGYLSDASFIRAFKQYFGYPPGLQLSLSYLATETYTASRARGLR